MRIPLIVTLEANAPEVAPFPALDSSARLRRIHSDGDHVTMIKLDKIGCLDSFGGRMDTVFGFDEPSKQQWEVTFTSSRIMFWHPMTVGIFGNKPKLKSGKATGGHLYYDSIGGLSAGYMNGNIPFLSCTCLRQDGTMSHIYMQSDISTLEKVVKECHLRISSHLESAGFSDNDEIRQKWASFPDSIWKQKDADVRVVVPYAKLFEVANRRV